jgi:hypothetical protein
MLIEPSSAPDVGFGCTVQEDETIIPHFLYGIVSGLRVRKNPDALGQASQLRVHPASLPSEQVADHFADHRMRANLLGRQSLGLLNGADGLGRLPSLCVGTSHIQQEATAALD